MLSDCLLQLMPPDDAATITVSAPFIVTGDFAANHNPSALAATITAGNPTVPAGNYLAWCVDVLTDISENPTSYEALLFSSCDPNLNAQLPAGHPASVYVSPETWKAVNYLLNHKNGASFWNVQLAVWKLVGGPAPDAFLHSPYPTANNNTINALVNSAITNSPTWELTCGNVMAAVVAIQNWPAPIQLVIIEVPIPCLTSVGITKQVACLLPDNNCGTFSHVAQAYKGLENPAFCYQITVTNSGTVPLTNLTVIDDKVGNITTNFFPNPTTVLSPGQSVTAYFKMAWSETTTNTATVSGKGTKGGAVVSAFDKALAVVEEAGVACTVVLTSPADLDGNPNDNHVLLPGCGAVSTVLFNVHVSNPSTADLTGVTISSPSMLGLNCSLPAPFDLPAGSFIDYQCSATVTCTGSPLQVNVNVAGKVKGDSLHCAYDITSTNMIDVISGCSGTVECAPGMASLSGFVILQCDSNNPNGGSAMPGVLVTLFDSSSNSVASVNTDSNGAYAFSNLTVGAYTIVVTQPTNTVQTLDYDSVLDNQTTVTLTACQDLVDIDFGYKNSLPPVIDSVPNGGDLGCNPASLPDDASIKAQVTASDDMGTPTVTVTHVDSGSPCASVRTFTVIAIDGCGNSSPDKTVVFTYKVDTNAPSITTVPTGGDLGCNPASIPTDASIKGLVVAVDDCGTAVVSVTHIDGGTPCAMSRTFTIAAVDSCGNPATPKTVTYTWKADTTAPSITVVPTGGDLGCNPASLPTDASIKTAVVATDNCGTPTVNVTHIDGGSACAPNRIFTITAVDSCGNPATPRTVTFTWKADSIAPVITVVPTGGDLGCNPASLPTDTTVKAAVVTTDACGPVTVTVTHVDSGAACAMTRKFTINAVDGCGNAAVAKMVTYTWKADTTAPVVTCPPNADITTNRYPKPYCTFSESGWGCTPDGNHNGGSILCTNWGKVYRNSGCIEVGTHSSGYHYLKCTSPNYVRNCIPTSGTPGCLSTDHINPSYCSGGSFSSHVLCLQLNVDFHDNGCIPGCTGRFGDLIYSDSSSPCHGMKVRDILSLCNKALGGGSLWGTGCKISDLNDLCDKLNKSCEGGTPNSWFCDHMYPRTNSIPTPSQTGTATAVDNCDGNLSVTYTDAVTNGPCAGGSIIYRTWKAVDSCGNVGTCTQKITIGCPPTPLKLSCVLNDSGTVGTSFSSSVVVTGGVGPFSFEIVAGSLPDGLNLNPDTGAITGTPTSSGVFNFAIEVTDSTGATATSGCSLGCSTAVIWDFTSHTGNLGTSETYTVNGVTITAYGYSNSGYSKNLYGKNDSGDEKGVGIAGTSNNEITTSTFVQLDLGALISSGATSATIKFGSVQAGEGYNIYGSNTKGSLGTLLGSGNSDNVPVALPGFPNYRYVSVRASAEDVLVSSIGANYCNPTCSITVSNPCTASICGTIVRDCNGDGKVSTDPGMQGVTVTLKKGTTTVATKTTDSNGKYCFTGLAAGSYTVNVTTPSGFKQTYDSDSVNDGVKSVTLTSCQNKTGVDFGYYGTSCGIQVTCKGPSSCRYGDTVTYTCTVVNTGNACFSGGCQVVSGNCGWSYNCPPLKPGESCTFTKQYTTHWGDSSSFNCDAHVTGYAWSGTARHDHSCNTQISWW